MPRPPAQNPNRRYVPAARNVALAGAIAAALTVSWEGRVFVAYDDFQPKKVLKAGDKIIGTLTVCTGHTDAGGGPPIVIGKKYTVAECDAYLALDRRAAVATVQRCTPELYENPPTAGAAEDFALNYGPRYCTSGMVKKFKAGDIRGGCAALLDFVYSKHKFMQGLFNRRNAEMKTCTTGLDK